MGLLHLVEVGLNLDPDHGFSTAMGLSTAGVYTPASSAFWTFLGLS
jgi:hypothetical protein